MGPSLFVRVFVANAVVLGAACAVLILTPVTISNPAAPGEIAIIVGGLALMLLINAILMRRAFAPLGRLTRMTREVELLEPGRRLPVERGDAEVVELTRAFNEMVDRLERERRESVRRSVEAQEEERRRIAQELHDQVGQTLTAAVLHLNLLERELPPSSRETLEETRETVRDSLNDVRRISRLLRPEALDDLGLTRALEALLNRMRESSGIPIDSAIDEPPPILTPEQELVVYRVAQEAITNALRHADASRIRVELASAPWSVVLTVDDDGSGIGAAAAGAGIQGMRERALLVGARLAIGPRTSGGTEVRLELPLADAG